MTDALLYDLRALADGAREVDVHVGGGNLVDRQRMVPAHDLRDLIAKHTPEPDVSERYELARVIWETSRGDEGTISATGANIVADAILAAGWRRR